ncbi:MAG: DUF4907 domain-containing protein [Puia sp.]
MGYNIIAEGKVHIKQEYMPAVPGKRGFKSAADAMLVGNLVIKKLPKIKCRPFQFMNSTAWDFIRILPCIELWIGEVK